MAENGGAPSQGGFSFNGPTIVALCYLGGFITGISGLVGIVLAYIWRGEARPEWEKSHFTFQIRTFWIALIGSFVGAILSIIGIGLLILLAITVWVVVRCVVSLLRAQRGEAMADPQSWMI